MHVKPKIRIRVVTTAGRKITFTAANAIEINKSVDNIGSTATIKIPISARLEYAGTTNTESIQTAQAFGKGDKVSIELGYDNRYYEEFEGYINKLNLVSPLEIECIGHEFTLMDNIPTKTFVSTTLKDLLQYIVSGKNITIDGDVPEVEMRNYVIPANLTRLDALEQIKERYGLTLYFLKNTLYAGLDFVKYLGNTKYSIGVNTKKSNELLWQNADDIKLKIKAIGVQKNNTRIEEELGDADGAQRTLFFYNVSSKTDLKKLAEAEILKYKYTGYRGKIKAKLEPFTTPGHTAQVIDIKYPERGGKYEIRSVVTTCDGAGINRDVEIGKIVSV